MNSTTKTIFSQAWNLIKEDVVKIAVGLAIGIGGALLTYFQTSFIGDTSYFIDSHVPATLIPLVYGLLTAVNSGVINTLRKWLGNTTYISHRK